MPPSPTPVTRPHRKAVAFASSEAAEDAFYAAFSAADVQAMMQVWASSPDIVCIHPGGPRLEGQDEIRHSWELILRDPLQRHFARRGLRIVGTGELRIHLLEEKITVPGTNFVAPPVLATNVYQRFGDSWQLMLHHGSVSPASLASGPRAVADRGAAGRLH